MVMRNGVPQNVTSHNPAFTQVFTSVSDTCHVKNPPLPLTIDTFPDVVVAARAGETWAAESLFIDLQPRLLRFLRSAEPRQADDLAGEVWLAVARGLHDFSGDLSAFRAWTFSIARRRLADFRRTAVRRATDPVDDSAFVGQADLGTDVSAAALAALSAQGAVDFIVASLVPDQAEVLLLRVLGDLDADQVGEVMGRSANWVRVTQHRALARLADLLTTGDAMAQEMWADPVMNSVAETI
jgi:RNA polymerase sigma-70 factor (ECF subfamily)